MKLFLIKIGKAFSALKRDGFWNGGKRIVSYLGQFMKTLTTSFRSGDVLIIASGVGDSAHYRAFNVAEELNLHGIKTVVTMQDNPFLTIFAKRFRVFIFQRTIVTPTVEKLIAKIKRQQKKIIFETDDLVFDVKFMHATDSYKNMSKFEKMQYKKGVGEEILADPYVAVCTASTRYIADILEEKGKKVFLVLNKINQTEQQIAQEIVENKQERNDDNIRLGYFSGTMGHNRDFATITNALIKILEKYPQVKLLLVGPLETESRLNQFSDRIEQLPMVSREKHYHNIAQVDINLAPLELGDAFCEAKSELKFFEAGIVEVPTVAVANQTFSGAITDGVDGFLAHGTDEWVEKLSRLIEDEGLRKSMGEKARKKALANYTVKNARNEAYYSYLRHFINFR